MCTNFSIGRHSPVQVTIDRSGYELSKRDLLRVPWTLGQKRCNKLVLSKDATF